jgi:probable rRNA maturation factor
LNKINVKNIHPQLKISWKSIRLLVENILKSEKVDSGVDVILVDDKFMIPLNRKFTKRNKTTDILSFGMKEDQRSAVEYPSLGDIYVSLDQAKRQAEEYKVKFEEEVRLLVAHGLLHLLGYDHKGKKEENSMRQKEKMYLKTSSPISSSPFHGEGDSGGEVSV